MNSLQFAAIDIGSNAVRLLIMGISPDNIETPFNKTLMIRVPLRLGQESFVDGKISDKKAKKLVRLMKAFKHLLKVYDVTEYRVCATAAMREATNAKELVKEIKKKPT
jgi:exopolyphosphatase/guanosine-5'-triphosphate,3'-diphosphate pyrophosphatase